MSVYTINYTDPTKPGFQLPQQTINGPGAMSAESTLRLYGRGMPNWGEGFDENFLRMLETFAGATEPLNPIEGLLWYKVDLYWRNTGTNNFFRWDYLTSAWVNITTSVTVSLTAPSNPAVADYWFDTTTSKLKRWDSLYQQATLSWLERSRSDNLVDPLITNRPRRELLAWNGSTWVNVAVAARTSTPSDPELGQLYLDTATKIFSIYKNDIDMWVPIITADGVVSFSGDLDLGGNKITSLGNATVGTDALNMQTGDLRYVNVSGDTMTGALSMGTLYKITDLANPTLGTDALNLQTAESLYVNVSGDTMTGFLTLNANPTANLHAATKQYVDSAGSLVNPVTPKTGDIQVLTGPLKISIYGGGAWRQVYPAVYA